MCLGHVSPCDQSKSRQSVDNPSNAQGIEVFVFCHNAVHLECSRFHILLHYRWSEVVM